jgi:hypothetical protein
MTDTIPSLSVLEVTVLTTSDYSRFIIELSGYEYGISIIEFIDKTYGFAKVVELYENPDDYQKVFGFSKAEFERQWKKYLEDSYRPSNLVNWRDFERVGSERTINGSNGVVYKWYFVNPPAYTKTGLLNNYTAGTGYGTKTGDVMILSVNDEKYLCVDLGEIISNGQSYRSYYRVRIQ